MVQVHSTRMQEAAFALSWPRRVCVATQLKQRICEVSCGPSGLSLQQDSTSALHCSHTLVKTADIWLCDMKHTATASAEEWECLPTLLLCHA